MTVNRFYQFQNTYPKMKQTQQRIPWQHCQTDTTPKQTWKIKWTPSSTTHHKYIIIIHTLTSQPEQI